MNNAYADGKPAPAAPAPSKPAGPQPNPGIKQIDGNQSGLGMKPSRASLNDRSASPAGSDRSGMEGALGALADKLHPPRFKGRR